MDWQKIISEVQAERGMSQPQIAEAVGCAQATVSDLATGKTAEPRYALGAAILGLLGRTQSAEPAPAVAANNEAV